MRTLGALAAALTGVFMLLNALGGIASGIWLAILGEWWAFGLGIIGIFVSHLIISIALIPSFGLSAAAYAAIQRGYRTGGMLIGAFSNFYIAALITIWCIAILSIFMSHATSTSWLPLLIWSYGVAIGPWAFLAQKDVQAGTGEGAVTLTFFAQLAYLVLIVAIAFFSPTVPQAAAIFGGIVALGAIQNIALGWFELAPEMGADRSSF